MKAFAIHLVLFCLAQSALASGSSVNTDENLQAAYAKLKLRGKVVESTTLDTGAAQILIARGTQSRIDYVEIAPAGSRIKPFGPLKFGNHSNAQPVLMYEWTNRRPTLRRAVRMFTLNRRLFALTHVKGDTNIWLEEIQFGIGAPYSTRKMWQRYQAVMTPVYAGAGVLLGYEFFFTHPVPAIFGTGVLWTLASSVFSSWQQGQVELGARTTVLKDYRVKQVVEDALGRVRDVVLQKADGAEIWLSQWMASCPDWLSQTP